MDATNREDELILAAQRVLDEHEAWENAGIQQLPESFLVAVDDCCTTWQYGDIPERCRSVLPTLEKLTAEWRSFETYVSTREPLPRREFWEAIGGIRNALTWAPPAVQEFYCETVQELLDQKVSPRQIALIYSHEGRGPFVVDGQPQPALVQREAKHPGSVLGADFVHPRTVAEREARAKYTNFLAYRAKTLKGSGTPPTGDGPEVPVTSGPETIEDLIAQGLNDHQISVTKALPLDEVRRVREELDAAKRGVPEGRVTIPFPSNVPDGDDEAPAVSDGQIADYLASNPGATNGEAARTLGVETRRVAVVRKQSQQRAAA